MSHQSFATNANAPASSIQFATSPRYLAGGGDPRHITQALRAAGWSSHAAPDYPHVLLASPDHSLHLVLAPATPNPSSAWWRIGTNGDGARWFAEFGGHTPVEIIAGLTDALIRPAPTEVPEVWQELTRSGWTASTADHGHEQAVSPDGIVRMERHSTLRNGRFIWRAEAALNTGLGGHDLIWCAFLDDTTPHYLIAAFATALGSTDPVYRPMYDVPVNHLVSQDKTRVQAEQLTTTHQSRLTAARTAARTARRAPLTAAPPPPTATASPSTTARSRRP